MSNTALISREQPVTTPKSLKSESVYGVEYFHIYTDESITARHTSGLEYLKNASDSWNFEWQGIILVDNYNPKVHITGIAEILSHVTAHNMRPDYWAYEGDLVENAKVLINNITNNRLRKNYIRYIEQHQKYPCSLLTASWYLTRLGYLPSKQVIHSLVGHAYRPSDQLINILPEGYESIESRAINIIKKSVFYGAADLIEDQFYPLGSERPLELF